MTSARPSLVRFSLRTLLALMMLMCIALATTVSASPRFEYAMKWVSALAPAAAILLAAGTMAVKRAFWIGFAAFGLWAYVQLCVQSENQDSLKNVFSDQFRGGCEDYLATLHSAEVEAEAMKRLRESCRYIFLANPSITLMEINVEYPKDYGNCMAGGRKHVSDRSQRIAWHNLHLAIAMFGGFAVAFVYAWRSRQTNVSSEAAGMNPAAR